MTQLAWKNSYRAMRRARRALSPQRRLEAKIIWARGMTTLKAIRVEIATKLAELHKKQEILPELE